MTDARPDTSPDTPETIEAESHGERPDLGRTSDTLRDALTGSGVGSDTRAGSLQGGAATGSDDDPDQAAVDKVMADQGRAGADPQSPSDVGPDALPDTGAKPSEADADPAEGRRDDDADAATG